MAVTPNYSWPVPVATDYVKDGWEAISDLGNAIDTTVAGLGSGLNLVKTQTIGTGVSSVIVTDAFSATYDAYKIIISGGSASAETYLQAQMRTGTTTSTASYYYAAGGATYAGSLDKLNTNNGSSWTSVGSTYTTTNSHINFNVDLVNPFLTKPTLINAGVIGAAFSVYGTGIHKVDTSYDQIVLTPQSGTLTGGTIRVYGYKNS